MSTTTWFKSMIIYGKKCAEGFYEITAVSRVYMAKKPKHPGQKKAKQSAKTKVKLRLTFCLRGLLLELSPCEAVGGQVRFFFVSNPFLRG